MKANKKKVIVNKDGKIVIVNRNYESTDEVLKEWNIDIGDERDLWKVYLDLRYDNVINFEDEKIQEVHNVYRLKIFNKVKNIKEKRIKCYKDDMRTGIHRRI